MAYQKGKEHFFIREKSRIMANGLMGRRMEQAPAMIHLERRYGTMESSRMTGAMATELATTHTPN